MLLTIEPDGPVPIYQQIRDRIVEAIASGEQPAGSPLPSTRQLAMDLGVNFHTVNKSYDILRQEGLVRINRKSGAVIRRDAGSGPASVAWTQDWTGRLATFLAEAAAQGMGPEEIVRHCRAAIAAFAFPDSVDDAVVDEARKDEAGKECPP
jgi:GntR family transcriptional regulator